MENPCPSPFIFNGLPWENWTNAIGNTSKIEGEPPEPKMLTEKHKAGVIKLPKRDMKIFGLCPERDLFSLVHCNVCNMYVKPQALLHHFEKRHSRNDVNPHEVFAELPVPEKLPTKVVKTIVKQTTTKLKTKKSTNKSKEVNPPHSLPISLVIETSLTNPALSKGETLQPIVALTQLPGASGTISTVTSVLGKHSVSSQAPATVRPLLKVRRAPRKHAPIKEREYDPNKHCGVISPETLKPCTWSLTCKSHPMSLRRAVPGRSKPFDQLLSDHRQAKEALLKQKKNLEAQNSSVITTHPAQVTTLSEPKRVFEKPQILEKLSIRHRMNSVLLRVPEIKVKLSPSRQIYLSAANPSIVVKDPERPSTSILPPTTGRPDFFPFRFGYPKPLSVSPMLSNRKIGGLMCTNRSMQVVRRDLHSHLHRTVNGYRGYVGGFPTPSSQTTLRNVINRMPSRPVKSVKRKLDKPIRSNKKVCLSKETDPSVSSKPINGFKSILSKQYSNMKSQLSVSTSNSQLIPNIVNNSLKRSDSPPKSQSKKPKNSTICSVVSNHSKNGLVSNKSNVPYVHVAISSGTVETDNKTLGLCETPKFANSTKILNESDLRKIGLRYEICD